MGIMRFMSTGKATYGTSFDPDMDDGSDFTSVTSRGPPLSPLESFYDAQKLAYGDWCSEAAIWIVWQNHGRLMADHHCSFLNVDGLVFADSVKEHPRLRATVAAYANKFVEALGDASLSDLLHFEVVPIKFSRKTALSFFSKEDDTD